MTPEKLKKAREFAAQLAEAGLTPFDLCSWETLLCLTERTGALTIMSTVHQEVEAATRRKAEVLDAERETDFYTKLLGDLT